MSLIRVLLNLALIATWIAMLIGAVGFCMLITHRIPPGDRKYKIFGTLILGGGSLIVILLTLIGFVNQIKG